MAKHNDLVVGTVFKVLILNGNNKKYLKKNIFEKLAGQNGMGQGQQNNILCGTGQGHKLKK